MKVPWKWIEDLVELPKGTKVETVCDALIARGVEIEDVQDGLFGTILDLGITANRSDLLSMLGVAREVALALGTKIKEPEIKFDEKGDDVTKVTNVTTKDLKLCPRYIARVVKGVKFGPSPGWMQQRLEGAGIRSINVLVDITNYVLLECGQPLHAFDLSLLKGPEIIVRPAKKGEKMKAIDQKEYELTPEQLLICDKDRGVAIAGVMGGLDSEIREETKDVLIESAQFDPVSIRRTSRKLKLASESSYRFERGVDWETVEWASRRAAQLMAELAGGTVCRGAIDVKAEPPKREPITVRCARMTRVMGMEIPQKRVAEILEGLGCRILESGDVFKVEAPSRRRDIKAEVDLIEEVIRVEGYDKLPTDTNLVQRATIDRRDDIIRDRTKEILLSLGCWEVCTWSFTDAGTENRVPYWCSEKLVPLVAPDGSVDRLLRESMVPELLKVLERNVSYKEKLHPIYEIAAVYYPTSQGYEQKHVLGIAAPGGALEVKGLIDRLLSQIGLPARFDADEAPWLEEGTGAAVVVGCKSIGYLGQSDGMGVAELDFEAIHTIADLTVTFTDFSRRPPVDRDLSLIVKDEVTWGQIESAVLESGPEWLESVQFGEIFRKSPIPKGSKSVLMSLRFRTMDRTLKGEEVDQALEGILKALKKDLNASLRA